MNLEFNETAKINRIESAYKTAMNQISQTLQEGNDVIELYIDKDVASDVRDKIDSEIERQGKSDNFRYLTVYKKRNDLGNHVMKYYTSMLVGDQRFYKLQYDK